MARELAGEAFGEQLRKERERRGIAVEAICATTKVPARHILALESGAFEVLPGGIFRRGFVRSYLVAIGLDESTWMARFEESCRISGVGDPGEAAWAAFAENVKKSRSRPRRRLRPIRIWGGLVLGLMAGSLALAAIRARHRNHAFHPHPWRFVNSWVREHTSR